MISLKILITEDDNVSALLLKKALEKNNHQIIGMADSGEMALEILENKTADIVMMDINLAGKLDGIKTTEIINEKFNIPVVYLTASSDSQTLTKVAGTNPSAYVIKPFNIRELNMVLELATFKDRKEKDLQSLNNELEEKVKQRTADLNEANKDLQKALEKEIELSELKSRIVQNVSHGFKTPLTSILSSAQLLKLYAEKDHPFKAKIVKHASKIENSTRNLNSLLTSILFFGKADAEKMNYKPTKIYTSAFFKELVDVVTAGIENDVTMKTTFGKLPKIIITDSDCLFQIFENLLSNAIKYSKNGGNVEFNLWFEEDLLQATVKDDGIGILKKEQDQIFERFFRAKNVGIIEGSGLGLSIVKKCVDLTHGSISFKSEPTKGTTFQISIPVTKNK